jgi:mannose/cellobiose epimerase-like protein (N-acyl-D-glucosamine 2-epimerase family)
MPDRDTFLVYQARMTWTAAAFARYSPAHRDEYAGYARHGIAFLDGVMRDKEFGGFHWMLDPRGRLDPGLGDEKHAYGISFVIYAGATVRDVTGDDLAPRLRAMPSTGWTSTRTTRSTAATSRHYAATGRRSPPGMRRRRSRGGWTGSGSTTASRR